MRPTKRSNTNTRGHIVRNCMNPVLVNKIETIKLPAIPAIVIEIAKERKARVFTPRIGKMPELHRNLI